MRMIPLLPDVAAEAGTFAALLVVGGIGMTYLLSMTLRDWTDLWGTSHTELRSPAAVGVGSWHAY